MNATRKTLLSRLPDVLNLASLAGQVALLVFCVVFVLPRVLMQARERGVVLPSAVARTMEAAALLVRGWWLPAAAVAAGLLWCWFRTPPGRREPALRLFLGVLLALSTAAAAGTAVATVLGLVLVGRLRATSIRSFPRPRRRP